MIKKEAHTPPWWPKIESGLRGISNLPANIRNLLAAGKVIYDSTPPPGVAPNAKAFVTTEDTDDDGKLDSVHMVITNIEKEIPPDVLSKINQMELSDPALQSVLSNIAKTLIHEVAHLDDYNPEHGFPGGEAVAESKERSFEPIFAETTTNKKIGIDNNAEITFAGDYNMQKELIKLSNHLDSLGHRDLADRLDRILKAASESRDISKLRKEVGRLAEKSEAMAGEDSQRLSQESEAVEESSETAAESGDEANDFEIEAMSAQDRINKMAELMAGEFTVNVPEHYRKY